MLFKGTAAWAFKITRLLYVDFSLNPWKQIHATVFFSLYLGVRRWLSEKYESQAANINYEEASSSYKEQPTAVTSEVAFKTCFYTYTICRLICIPVYNTHVWGGSLPQVTQNRLPIEHLKVISIHNSGPCEHLIYSSALKQSILKQTWLNSPSVVSVVSKNFQYNYLFNFRPQCRQHGFNSVQLIAFVANALEKNKIAH